MRPYVQPIQDWWYVNVGDGPSYVVSRCGETAVTLSKSFYLYPVPDEPSALYCDEDGLYRVDLAEDETITRLHPAPYSCSVKDYDEVGGYFFEVGSGGAQDPFLRGESSEQDGLNEVWHVSTRTTAAKPVQIHPSARGPFKMADGWYLHTEAGQWARIVMGTRGSQIEANAWGETRTWGEGRARSSGRQSPGLTAPHSTTRTLPIPCHFPIIDMASLLGQARLASLRGLGARAAAGIAGLRARPGGLVRPLRGAHEGRIRDRRARAAARAAGLRAHAAACARSTGAGDSAGARRLHAPRGGAGACFVPQFIAFACEDGAKGENSG